MCCAEQSAMLRQHALMHGQAQCIQPQLKIVVTSKSPVEDIPVVTLIRTDTTPDHSQKAEKVCCCQCLPYTAILYQMHLCVYLIGVLRFSKVFVLNSVWLKPQLFSAYFCQTLRSAQYRLVGIRLSQHLHLGCTSLM